MHNLMQDTINDANSKRDHTSFIGLKLAPWLILEIDAQAKREDRSRSAIVREAIRKYLAAGEVAAA